MKKITVNNFKKFKKKLSMNCRQVICMNINLIAYYRFVIITLVLLLQFIVKLPISQRPVMMSFFACHVSARKKTQLSESGKD